MLVTPKYQMPFTCVQFHITVFKLAQASIEFSSIDFKTFSKFLPQMYLLVSSSKLHMLTSFMNKDNAFR